MELWIRSQDRNVLMPINSKLELLYDEPEHILIISANTILGAYKSRQRVLEVLDEIQNILQPRVYMKAPLIDNPKDMIEDLTNGICLHTTQQVELELKQAGQFVYQMPKE